MGEPTGNELLPGVVERVLPLRDSAAVVIQAGSKRFLIFVGPNQADAIQRERDGVRMERPLTHDVISYVMKGFDIDVAKVVISSIVRSIFCATLVLVRRRDGNQESKDEVRLDIRASDAIIIALKTDNPLWVTRQVVAEVEDVSKELDEIDRRHSDAGDGEGDEDEDDGFTDIDIG
jgi:bifunctional DNase/RNase